MVYCVLCQEGHEMNDTCMEQVVCKQCGEIGHLNIKCSLDQASTSSALESSDVPEKNYCFEKDVHLDYSYLERTKRKKSDSEDTLDVATTSGDFDINKPKKSRGELEKMNTNVEFPTKPLPCISEPDEMSGILVVEDSHEENSNIYKKLSPSLSIPGTCLSDSVEQSNNVVNVEARKKRRKESPLPNNTDYQLVFVHIETFRSNKSSKTKITQIGCCLGLSGFFCPIKPSGLNQYLDCYKLGGDLLKLLHMTREDNGIFLFRKQFEIITDPNKKVFCVSEKEAIKTFFKFLEHLSNCILIGVDEDSLSILAKKMKDYDRSKFNKVVGYTYWRRILKYLYVPCYKDVDLEEFYKEFSKNDLPSYFSSKDIATLLRLSVQKVFDKYGKRRSLVNLVCKTCKKIEYLPRPIRKPYNKKASKEDLEVYSSFRPSVTATISAERLEQVTVSSESEKEDDDARTNNPVDEYYEKTASTEKTVNEMELDIVKLEGNNAATDVIEISSESEVEEEEIRNINERSITDPKYVLFKSVLTAVPTSKTSFEQVPDVTGPRSEQVLDVTTGPISGQETDSTGPSSVKVPVLTAPGSEKVPDITSFEQVPEVTGPRSEQVPDVTGPCSVKVPVLTAPGSEKVPDITSFEQVPEVTGPRSEQVLDVTSPSAGQVPVLTAPSSGIIWKFKNSGSILCPSCESVTYVKYVNLSNHLLRVHKKNVRELSGTCDQCLDNVKASGLINHVESKHPEIPPQSSPDTYIPFQMNPYACRPCQMSPYAYRPPQMSPYACRPSLLGPYPYSPFSPYGYRPPQFGPYSYRTPQFGPYGYRPSQLSPYAYRLPELSPYTCVQNNMGKFDFPKPRPGKVDTSTSVSSLQAGETNHRQLTPSKQSSASQKQDATRKKRNKKDAVAKKNPTGKKVAKMSAKGKVVAKTNVKGKKAVNKSGQVNKAGKKKFSIGKMSLRSYQGQKEEK